MDTWVEEIEGWETRPVSDGYDGLHELADEGFSGAVSAGSAWLFMVSGRVVGVFEYRRTATEDTVEPADIDRFEGADGTAYAAPDPSVPLLVAMKAHGGETRGKYYTEDTPLAEVDDTLGSGGFTGYLELSENVLSGDYYAVYQAGRSSELAFVGNVRRLLTGEEAEERARDEVGIYEVVAVDLDVVDVPDEPDTGSSAVAAGPGPTADEPPDAEPSFEDESAGDGPADDKPVDDESADDESADDGGPSTGDARTAGRGQEESRTARPGPGDSGTEARTRDSEEPAESTPGGAEPEGTPPGQTEPEESTLGEAESEESVRGDAESDDSAGAASGADEAVTELATNGDERAVTSESPGTNGAGSATPSDEGDDGWPAETPAETEASPASDPLAPETAIDPVTSGDEEPDHSGRAIPSVDPDRTEAVDGTAATENEPDQAPADETEAADPAGRPDRIDQPNRTEDTAPAGEPSRSDQTAETSRTVPTGEPSGEVEQLREELSSREQELAEARERLESVTDERDELAAEVERLREEVERLSAKLNDDGDGPSLAVAEAYAGTNLFVRYESKGKTTLEDVYEGAGDLEDLHANLRVEHHTTFPTEGATVEGRPFAEWLGATQSYRFVEWLVEDLLAEIRDAGAADGMRDLYDVLPAIDRIEFQGSVDVEDEEGRREVGYDVVCRDRMGQPLIVADADDSREPVREQSMADLVNETTGVANVTETLAGAFYVSASFFEADALETAREATSGSLLSRDSRRSFVKLSRKSGFHLCLVEARDETFYLSVPDL